MKSKPLKQDTETVTIIATALKEAFYSVGCDLKCFDWLSYSSDKYRIKYGSQTEEEKSY